MRQPKSVFACVILFALTTAAQLGADKPAAAATDSLGRTNPRSAVTGFLEACQQKDYAKAANYLDLSLVAKEKREEDGPRLAQQLETILNSDASFTPLRVSESAQGDLQNQNDPALETISTIKKNGHRVPLDLQRSEPANGPAIWLFSAATVGMIPSLVSANPQSRLESRLPRFLVASELLGTPLWKWLCLLTLAVITIVIFRLAAHIISDSSRGFAEHVNHAGTWMWLRAVLEPLLVFVFVAVFAIGERWVAPSAISRLYIGRLLLLVVVWSVAWGIISLIDLFLRRLNSLLDAKQRVVSHSLIYVGRKVARALVVISAAIMILSNWGYDMSTIIAGLGVGGIAIALAAQQTIANIFGGVSVIGDNPVMVGDFGNFGGLIGTVEDIGMRSTRVRTLNRTLVSVPNGAFAGMNLENYSLRDKILFNPTLQIKRTSPKEQIRRCMDGLREMLAGRKEVELVPTPVRLSTYSAASFGLEIFAYVLTKDINEFYTIESDLYLAMDDVVTRSGVELV